MCFQEKQRKGSKGKHNNNSCPKTLKWYNNLYAVLNKESHMKLEKQIERQKAMVTIGRVLESDVRGKRGQ